MLKIDRRPPTFISRAVGLLSGHLFPAADGQCAILRTLKDEREISLRVSTNAMKKILQDPSILVNPLDLLVWPKTKGFSVSGMIVDLKPAARYNPDRDRFLIQGVTLMGTEKDIVRIGIRPNHTDRNNTSNFERFWLNLKGHVTNIGPNRICQIQCKRVGKKLYILSAKVHIKELGRWKLIETSKVEDCGSGIGITRLSVPIRSSVSQNKSVGHKVGDRSAFAR